MSAHEDLLRDVLTAWESLPGGRTQSVRDVERWLASEMAPAMQRVRDALSEAAAARASPEVEASGLPPAG